MTRPIFEVVEVVDIVHDNLELLSLFELVRHIECLDPEICPCSTMYMIHPAYLMDLLEKLVDGQVHNQITVSNEVQEGSLLALERMLSIRV